MALYKSQTAAEWAGANPKNKTTHTPTHPHKYPNTRKIFRKNITIHSPRKTTIGTLKFLDHQKKIRISFATKAVRLAGDEFALAPGDRGKKWPTALAIPGECSFGHPRLLGVPFRAGFCDDHYNPATMFAVLFWSAVAIFREPDEIIDQFELGTVAAVFDVAISTALKIS